MRYNVNQKMKQKITEYTKKVAAAFVLLSSFYLLANVVNAQSTTPPQPSIQISLPANGETYGGNTVELQFSVKNFTFVSYKNFTVLFPGNPNAGHAHMWIDPPPIGADANTVYEIESPDYHELPALEPGNYDLTIELVKNDHTSFQPKVYETVSFHVNERTDSGKYSIGKTGNAENVGKAPPKKIGRVVGIILIILILIGLFIRYRKKIKSLILTKVLRRKEEQRNKDE